MRQRDLPPKGKVNTQKVRNLLVLFLGSLVLISQYQNCAPANIQAGSGSGGSLTEDPMPVSIIDDVQADSAVAFKSEQIEIHTEVDQVVLEGACSQSQNGSILGWKIRDGNSQDLGGGYVKCENGKFQVELAPTQELECGADYEVTARLGLGEEGRVLVLRRCAPEAVIAGVAMKASIEQAQPNCVLEVNSQASTPCLMVCYSGEGVVLSQETKESVLCGI